MTQASEHFYEDPIKRREDDHRMALQGDAREDLEHWSDQDGMDQNAIDLLLRDIYVIKGKEAQDGPL